MTLGGILRTATPAACAAAVTLAMLLPDGRPQRLLLALALASLLPALALPTLGARLRRATNRASIGTAAFFAAAVTISALAVDPGARDPFDAPKLYLLLGATAAGALVFAAVRVARPHGLRVTAIELLLAAALVWGVAGNPGWLAGEGAPWFWVALALLLLTALTRQLFGAPARRARARDDLFTALCVNGAAHAVLGFRQAYNAGAFRFDSGLAKTPMFSTLLYPNGYAAFLAAGLIGAVVMAVRVRRPFARGVLAGIAALQLAALLANGSRGALLGLLAAALLAAWLRLVFAVRRSGVVAPRGRALRASIAGAAVLALLATATLMLYRLNPESGRGRLIAWQVSAAMAADHPLRGVGAGRFGAEYATYQAALWRVPAHARWAHQAAPRIQPHSEVMYVLAERGLVGVAFFLLPWAVALAALVRALRAGSTGPPGTADDAALDWGLLALLVALLTHAGVDNTLHWMPVAVTAHLALGLVPATQVRLRPERRRGWIVLACATLALAAVVARKTAREYPAYREWRRAKALAGADAVASYETVRARLPGEARLDVDLATALLTVDRREDAITHLEHALRGHDDVDTRLLLAQALLDEDDAAAALPHARAALASFPDRLRPQLLLGRIHHALGDHAAARAALARCIQRRTHYDSAAVDSVVADAARLWRAFYDDEPPG